LIAIGVGEVSAAIKAGQIGVRMLVTADGMTMLAVGDSTVAAAKGAGAIVYGTASFATSLSDKGGGGACECSRAGDTASAAESAGSRAVIRSQGNLGQHQVPTQPLVVRSR
jgi:hypothetical protein